HSLANTAAASDAQLEVFRCMVEVQGGGVRHHGQPSIFEVLGEQRARFLLAGAVEVLKRLVQQQEPRRVEQGPGPAQPLPHAGRQGACHAVERQPQPLEDGVAPLRARPPQPGEEVQVLLDRQLLIEGEVRRHQAHPAAALGHVEPTAVLLILDRPRVRSEETAEAAEQGALAGAVGAGDQQHPSRLDGAGDAVEHRQPAEAAAEVVEAEGGGHGAEYTRSSPDHAVFGDMPSEALTPLAPLSQGERGEQERTRENAFSVFLPPLPPGEEGRGGEGFAGHDAPIPRIPSMTSMTMKTPRRGLAALLLLAACASPRTAPDLPAVEVPDLEMRALLLLLVDRQTFDDFTVQQALKGDASLREDLAVALGRIPDRQGRTVLQGLLLDDEAAVRRAAAFALGELEDPEAQTALFQAARDADRETAVLAVEALGKLGARVVDVAEALLTLPEEERWARLLPHLFRFKEETIVALAERGLTVADPA